MKWRHQPCGQRADLPDTTDPAVRSCPSCGLTAGVWEPQSGPDSLGWRNRRILAGRWRWPDGTVETCERLDRVFPRWSTMWRPVNVRPGFEHPAGFQAVMVDARVSWWSPLGWVHPQVSALSEALVEAAIRSAEDAVVVVERLRAAPLRSLIREP